MRSGASVSSRRPRVPLRKRVTLRHRAPGNDFSVARRVIGNFFGGRGGRNINTEPNAWKARAILPPSCRVPVIVAGILHEREREREREGCSIIV